MNLEDFKENYNLLNDIVKKHKKKFKRNIEFQTLLMPFYCFKIPYNILCDVGYLDTAFGNGGGEDIDYRIRCSIKGYDVNFLLDSYLLHFHGKSTWGVETKVETEARNKKYTEVFLKKWGREITQIFIARRDFFEILEKKEVKDLYDRGKFSDLIRKICKKK